MALFESIMGNILDTLFSSLEKMVIEKFDVSDKSKEKVISLIDKIESNIKIVTKQENSQERTQYRLENLENYYKLAKAYERLNTFSTLVDNYDKNISKAIKEIEVRLNTLDSKNKEVIIYRYLSDYYSNKDYEKSINYNNKVLELIDHSNNHLKAKAYYKEAQTYLLNGKYQKAKELIQKALKIEPNSDDFKYLEIEILLNLNKDTISKAQNPVDRAIAKANLRDILKKIDNLTESYQKKQDILQLSDSYILKAKYYNLIEDKNRALDNLNEAYKLIENLDDTQYTNKKLYLTTQIAILGADKHDNSYILNIAQKALELENIKYFSIKSRLDLIDIASELHNRAYYLFYKKAKYKDAELLFLKVLKIFEAVLGVEHPSTAATYNNLAELYRSQSRYEEAKEYYLKALKIVEAVLGVEHPDTATTYNNLAGLYHSQGRYEEAEHYFLKALEIEEAVLGVEHPSTATTYNNLAGLYESQGKYEEAEKYCLKDLKISEAVLGDKHPDTAATYKILAILYYKTKKFDLAYSYIQKAVEIMQKVLPKGHPNLLGSQEALEIIKRAIDED